MMYFTGCAQGISYCFLDIFSTRSYAALRAADLDWIARPGYNSVFLYFYNSVFLYFYISIFLYFYISKGKT